MKLFVVTVLALGFFGETYALSLSQDYVLKKVLSTSPHIRKLQLQKNQALSALLEKKYALYDWRLISSLGNLHRKNPQLSPFDALREEHKTLSAGFEKKLPYGLSFKSLYSDFTQDKTNSEFLKRFQVPTNTYRSQVSLELSLDLLRNIFGYGERVAFRVIKAGEDMTNWQYFETAEGFVLRAVGQYWAALIAHTTYEQMQKGLIIYRQLVAETGSKKKYGFLKPGERPQILAEYENIKQEVSKKQQDYREKLEELSLILQIPDLPEKAQFQKEIALRPSHSIASVNVEDLRPFKIRKKQVKEQSLKVKLAQSQFLPDLQFQSKLGRLAGSSGSEEYESPFSSSNNFYEISLNFLYRPFSKAKREQISKEKFKLEELKIDLALLKQELKNRLQSLKRKTQVSYQNVLSAEKSNKYRKQAFRELKISFDQGRVGIFELITAENKLRESEIKKAISLSEYFILSLQMEAFLDRLVK